MNTYNVYVNSVGFSIEASNRATALRRALNSYYHDDDITDDAQKMRKRDTIGRELRIHIKRVA